MPLGCVQLCAGSLLPPGCPAALAGRREGVLLLDSGAPDWTVLYTNDAFTAVSGVPRQQAVSRGFWELFGAPGQGPATFKASCLFWSREGCC